MRLTYTLVSLFFFLFLFIVPTFAYLPLDINTTITTAVGSNPRDLNCINATDNNIYCYFTTDGNNVYTYNATFGQIYACDFDGSFSNTNGVAGVNSTFGLVAGGKSIYLVNQSGCSVSDAHIDVFGGLANGQMAYYDTDNWVYTGENGLIIDLDTDSSLGNGVYGAVPDISLQNTSDNSTIWVGQNGVIDYIDMVKGSNNVSISDTWGIVNPSHWSIVKANPSTTWLYVYETTGVSTIQRVYRGNLTKASNSNPATITLVNPPSLSEFQEDEVVVLQADILSSNTGIVRWWLYNETDLTWSNPYNITVSSPPNTTTRFTQSLGAFGSVITGASDLYVWYASYYDSNGDTWTPEATKEFYIVEARDLDDLLLRGLGGLFGIDSDDLKLLLVAIIGLVVGGFLVMKAKGDSMMFGLANFFVYLVGWSRGWVPDYLMGLIVFAGLFIIVIRQWGG